mgnify:CR=1 FL=1
MTRVRDDFAAVADDAHLQLGSVLHRLRDNRGLRVQDRAGREVVEILDLEDTRALVAAAGAAERLAAAAGTREIVVVQNWFSELQKLVPVK